MGDMYDETEDEYDAKGQLHYPAVLPPPPPEMRIPDLMDAGPLTMAEGHVAPPRLRNPSADELDEAVNVPLPKPELPALPRMATPPTAQMTPQPPAAPPGMMSAEMDTPDPMTPPPNAGSMGMPEEF